MESCGLKEAHRRVLNWAEMARPRRGIASPVAIRGENGLRGSGAGTLGVPLGEPGVLGNFWGSQQGCQGPFRPSGRNRGSSVLAWRIPGTGEPGGLPVYGVTQLDMTETA